MPDMLINGVAGKQITASDRGLMYGDGVFRTILLKNGRLSDWLLHLIKLQHDCSVLGIECPEKSLLESELQHLTKDTRDAVVKIIVTRGSSGRGYTPGKDAIPNRILSLSALPDFPKSYKSQGIKVTLCQLHLSHQPRLAGIKHLNRLENVLASAEIAESEFAEGILLDQDDCVIEGTRSNLFVVRDGKLHTPDLSQCGVAGVQRDKVIALAGKHGMTCIIRKIKLEELYTADEIFLVNSVIGLWPVCEMANIKKQQFPVSHQFQAWMNV